MTAGKTKITLYTYKPRMSFCILHTIHPNVSISTDRKKEKTHTLTDYHKSPYVGLQYSINPTCLTQLPSAPSLYTAPLISPSLPKQQHSARYACTSTQSAADLCSRVVQIYVYYVDMMSIDQQKDTVKRASNSQKTSFSATNERGSLQNTKYT